jgi:toxin ParE1/3/4
MSGKKYSLKFTQKAYQDLDEIFSYISKTLCDEVAAENLINKIQQSVLRLKDYPYTCSIVSDNLLKAKGYRKVIVDNYIAFYQVDETETRVIIMRILYGAQKYQDLL